MDKNLLTKVMFTSQKILEIFLVNEPKSVIFVRGALVGQQTFLGRLQKRLI